MADDSAFAKRYAWQRQNERDLAEDWLRRVVAAKKLLDEEWDRLRKLIGCDCDSAFGSAVWEPITLLIEAVEQVISDDHAVLSWYVWENDCGAKRLEYSLPDLTMREVVTIDDLLDVLGYHKPVAVA